jgi:YjgF/chorismate_mutase-like, putative endoribonuclease
MTPEQRLESMGLKLQDFDAIGYYGHAYGKMKPYHLTGQLLFLSAHVPIWDGHIVHPGRLGEAVTIEQGYEAGRLTGLNVLAGVKQAVGELGRITSLVRSIIFIASAPEFTQVHKVADGMTDVLAEVLGEEKGTGGRAAIGVQRLANDICFEAWCTFEVE